ncbi:MAG: endonuclease MutS2 [Oscillospiraceae bacterium]|nr:endonuclease MutS2 [Oscillospiraceae bacterium]
MTDLQKSITTLEYDKILFQIAELAHTDGAKEKIKNLSPAIYPEFVVKLLQQTTDAKRLASVKGSPPFTNIKYVGDCVERAVKGATLAPIELLNIALVYRTARSLLNYNRTDKRFDTSIDVIFERLFTNRMLEDKITRTIISEDMIADEASAALADIRRKIKIANAKVREQLQKYTSGDAYFKYLQENIVTLRNGRYVIPVKTEYKNEIKGLVHDTSSSGATLFIEPLAVVEINNEIKILEKNEKIEIERILSELSANCADYADEIHLNYDNITELAVIFAKCEYSFKIDGVCPKIVDNKSVFFMKARHPLLDKSTVVPVDIGIGVNIEGKSSYDTLVITGPNTGGKTVSLKTLGLLIMMAQTGIHTPCDEKESYMSVFEDVLADIGDEQSIEQSLSTFSAHMVNIIKILNNISPNSVVLFDELGSGTDPVEGAALATAILEKVHASGALCAATTHYAELKVYALETEYARNASCEFDIETLKPTYRLTIGTPGRSNAFAISQRLGMSEDVIELAKLLVRSENKKFENVLSKLEEDRVTLEKEKVRAAQIRRELEIKNAETENLLKKKLQEAEKNLDKAREESRRLIASSKSSSNYIFAELEKLQKRKDEEDFRRTLTEMRVSLKNNIKQAENEIYSYASENDVEDEFEEDYVLPRELKKGDNVIIKDSNLTGTVENEIPDKDGNIQIKAGIINLKTDISNIRLLDEKSAERINKSKEKIRNFNSNSKKSADREIKRVSNEIDVRGQNGEDAWFKIDKFLDDSKLVGIESIRIIHGKGTGALRTALWRYFNGDKRIASFRLGQYGEGDSGVTVIELK